MEISACGSQECCSLNPATVSGPCAVTHPRTLQSRACDGSRPISPARRRLAHCPRGSRTWSTLPRRIPAPKPSTVRSTGQASNTCWMPCRRTAVSASFSSRRPQSTETMATPGSTRIRRWILRHSMDASCRRPRPGWLAVPRSPADTLSRPACDFRGFMARDEPSYSSACAPDGPPHPRAPDTGPTGFMPMTPRGPSATCSPCQVLHRSIWSQTTHPCPSAPFMRISPALWADLSRLWGLHPQAWATSACRTRDYAPRDSGSNGATAAKVTRRYWAWSRQAGRKSRGYRDPRYRPGCAASPHRRRVPWSTRVPRAKSS